MDSSSTPLVRGVEGMGRKVSSVGGSTSAGVAREAGEDQPLVCVSSRYSGFG